MRVRDVMSWPVFTVDVDTPVAEAARILTTHGVAALPVLDDGSLVGIASESDLLRDTLAAGGRRPDGEPSSPDGDGGPGGARPVSEVMTGEVVAVSPDAEPSDVATLVLDYGVRSVPVVHGGHVVGIVSRHDLIRLLVHDDEVVARDVACRLDEYAGSVRRWKVAVSDGVTTVSGDFDDAEERRVVEILARTVPGVRSVRIGPSTVPT